MPGLLLPTLAKTAIPAVAIGVILLGAGAAGYYTRSLHVPILMHGIGNLFAIWRSQGGGGAG